MSREMQISLLRFEIGFLENMYPTDMILEALARAREALAKLEENNG